MLFSLLVSVLFFVKLFLQVYIQVVMFLDKKCERSSAESDVGYTSTSEAQNSLDIYVTGSGKRYIVMYIFKIELFAPRDRVSSQL